MTDRARRFTELRERWGEIWAALALLRPDPASLRLALKTAGAPATPADLGFSAEVVERALLAAREIRNRYTALDLAAEVGLLDGWAREAAGRNAAEVATDMRPLARRE